MQLLRVFLITLVPFVLSAGNIHRFTDVKCESFDSELIVKLCEVSLNHTLEMIFDFVVPKNEMIVKYKKIILNSFNKFIINYSAYSRDKDQVW